MVSLDISNTDPSMLCKVLFGHDHWSKASDILRDVFQPNARIAIKGCNASSKALALDTPIPTPSGWATMETLLVGDHVFDEQGNPSTVMALSPVMEKLCYRVTFNTGESIVASYDHLWSVIDLKHRPRKILPQPKRRKGREIRDWRDHWDVALDYTTEAMASDMKAYGLLRWRIPTTRALKTASPWPLSTPPYTFGAWLGDGTTVRAEITVGAEDVEHMHRMVGGRIFSEAGRQSKTVVFGDRRTLNAPSREVGGKRIPLSVLRASIEDRMAVLRGLMDTDGWVTTGAGVSISQVRHDLARDIYELVVSLGYRASWREQRAVLNGQDCGPCYVISFAPDVCPFTLPRKVASWKSPGAQASRFTQRTIVSIDPVGVLPTRCITVDSASHLYLAGRDMIPTHNSYLAADAIVLALLLGGDVLTTAPTSDQLTSVLWRQARATVADCRLDTSKWQVNLTSIKLPTGELAEGRSTDQGVRFQGYHARPGSFLLIIVDEAPGVIGDIMDAIGGIEAGGDVRLLLLGNPIVPSGPYYEIFARSLPGWTTHTISAFDNDNLKGLTIEDLLAMPETTGGPLDENPRPYLSTRRWVRNAYLQHGADSPYYYSHVLGMFPPESADTLIPLGHLEMAGQIPGGPDAWIDPNDETNPGEPLVAGIDVAGPGEDETVVVIRQGRVILDVSASTTADSRGWALARLRPWIHKGLVQVNVDEIGQGYYYALHLREQLGQTPIQVIGVNVAERPLTRGAEVGFANLKAEAYWRLRERFRDGLVGGLSDQTLREQLATIRYNEDARGKIRIVGKDDMRRLGLKSPDRAEALMLAFAGGPDLEGSGITGVGQRQRLIGAIGSGADFLRRVHPVRRPRNRLDPKHRGGRFGR